MAGPTVRVTRVRSDIAQTAMTKDFVFQAASDQSELSNVRVVTQSVNAQCPIYSGCSVVGSGTPAQAAASVAAANAASSSSGNGDASGSGEDGGINDAVPNGSTNAGGCDASGGAASGADFAALSALVGIVLMRSRRRAAKS
jgi:hypothetical protein